MASELPKLMALVKFEDGPQLGAPFVVPIIVSVPEPVALSAETKAKHDEAMRLAEELRYGIEEQPIGGAALALLEWAQANPDEARKMNKASREAWLACPACGFRSPFIPCQSCGTEIPIEVSK